MPLAQLLRKLSALERAAEPSDRGAEERSSMECDGLPCFGVTAEVVSQPGLQHRSCDSLGSSSSAQAVFDVIAASAPSQHRRHTSPPPASSSLRKVGSLAGAPTGAASGQPATARVLRAKGKAAVRGHALHPDGALESTFTSSMSIELHSQGLCPVGSSGSTHFMPYHRSATDPVALWLATGSITNTSMQPLPCPKLALPNSSRAAAPDAGQDGSSHGDGDEDKPLASPVSPDAASNAHLQDEGEHHCEWEDGVIAGWLDGIDPTELITHHDDDEQGKQQLHESASAPGPAAAAVGVSRPERTASSVSSNAVYSSLLYS